MALKQPAISWSTTMEAAQGFCRPPFHLKVLLELISKCGSTQRSKNTFSHSRLFCTHTFLSRVSLLFLLSKFPHALKLMHSQVFGDHKSERDCSAFLCRSILLQYWLELCPYIKCSTQLLGGGQAWCLLITCGKRVSIWKSVRENVKCVKEC